MDSRKKKKGRPGAKQQKAAPQNANRKQPAARPANSQPQRPQPAAKPQPQRPQQTPKKPVKQLTPEQKRRTDRAYKQATVHRNVRSKRRGRRGGNYVMYYILAAAVIITVLIILANTVLFNCAAIEVEGNSRYTAEQIITQSGIEKGQNLLHIDTKAAQTRISAAFPFIDEVEVQRSFPTKIRIVVKEAEKWFQVSSGGVNAAVSRLGRIVELGTTPGLPVVEGYDPEELSPGKTLASNEQGKTPIPSQILEMAEECGLPKITRIDMTDRFDISVDCGDNITLLVGGVSDLSVKFAEAAGAIKVEKSDVTIDLRAEEKMFVRDKNEQEQVLPELGGTSQETSEPGTSAATGES